ncbi:hypothetical protein SLS62_008801 [Diatrype stigma]|uniref:Uncharacterized protein n=1 Tax=Diatrype stigma TaxID=117547 RepID=A0AAN9YMV7_9PEZI
MLEISELKVAERVIALVANERVSIATVELEDSEFMTDPTPFELDRVELAVDELIVVKSDIDRRDNTVLAETMLETAELVRLEVRTSGLKNIELNWLELE